MLFAPIVPMVFVLGCIAMMFLMIRRHRQLDGPTATRMRPFGTFGPWRTFKNMDVPGRQSNVAFEEYRQQTLRRLEQEQAEFKGFLEQLRLAKDKSEFDQFMTERQSAARS
jgi:Protein of unknown function (DUF2852)